MRTGPASQLDGKDSHTSCCALDQDGLSCNELRIFKEALPGRQRREWNGGGLHMVERAWFGSQLAGQSNSIFCLGPIAAVVQHGIDLGARNERRDTMTYRLYHSRKVTSRYRQCARVPRLGLIGHIPLQLVGNDPRRVDANQHLSCTCMGLWRIFVDQVIWTASAMQTDCFHVVVSLLLSRLVDHPATGLAYMG